ncbi:MAG: type II toxin-antitoxin system HicA family toxin [Defluviitaleaceae bacterium]|nr:type II toxin-antitoxin system HicA family toxin [Defluviitaleaceae bacterium]MCL2275866.1 type II toxin-antitoxin system HicA family toxin [Defluviitaleaceae bacterium]
MAVGYGAELKKILLKYGCTFVRKGKGDHEIWYSPITGNRFPVDNGTRNRHTANGILKQAGIPYKF